MITHSCSVCPHDSPASHTKIPFPVSLKMTNRPHACAEVTTIHTASWRALGDSRLLRYSSTVPARERAHFPQGSVSCVMFRHPSAPSACISRFRCMAYEKSCSENISHRSWAQLGSAKIHGWRNRSACRKCFCSALNSCTFRGKLWLTLHCASSCETEKRFRHERQVFSQT